MSQNPGNVERVEQNYISTDWVMDLAFSALMLLEKTEWWGAGVVICLELGADLHTAQLMPLPLTVSCFSKIQIGFTFLVPAHPDSPGQRAVKRVCVLLEWPIQQVFADATTHPMFWLAYLPWRGYPVF